MRKLLLSNHYEGMPLSILQEAIDNRLCLEVLDALDVDELKRRIVDADYLLVSGRMRIDGAVLERAERLRMIQRTGVGLDNMDLDYLRDHGIPLYVNQGVNAPSVAEHAVYLMLAALRRSYAVNRQMRKGIWTKQQTGLTTHTLEGKTVGIVGMGNIGSRVARLLSGFGATLLYYSVPQLTSAEEDALGVRHLPLDDLLRTCDIVTLHCPASENGPMLTRTRIGSMKEGAILVNTARGNLVDLDAVEDALDTGKLSAVGLDVFDVEPLVGRQRLLDHRDAIMSPHIAGVTYEAFYAMMSGAVENIVRFDHGDYEAIAASRYL